MNKGLRPAFSNVMKFLKLKYATNVKRKYPLSSPSMVWAEGMIPELDVEKYVYEEVKLEQEPVQLIDVLLSADVPGLGTAGSIVQIHRNRFWRYLYLTGLAELPSDERIEYIRSRNQGPAKVLCGESYVLQQHLTNMTLYIPMNPSTNWTLKPVHVKVAFRRYGIVIDDSLISLPVQQITRQNYAAPFCVNVSRFNLFGRLYSVAARSRLSDVFLIKRVDTSLYDFKIAPLNLGNKAALAHFDHLYTLTYGTAAWSSIRAALLTPPKQAALVNPSFPDIGQVTVDETTSGCLPTIDFIQTLEKYRKRTAHRSASNQSESIPEDIIEPNWDNLSTTQYTGRSDLINKEFVNLNEFVPVTKLIGENAFYSRDSDKDFIFTPDSSNEASSDERIDSSIKVIQEPVKLPHLLSIRCATPGSIEGLRDPRLFNGKLDYYPVDLGSALTILALGLEKGDNMIDLCAFSGIKSLMASQTGLLDRLITVPITPNRIFVIERTLNAFRTQSSDQSNKFELVHPDNLSSYVSQSQVLYNKILLDSPCSADRYALTTPGTSLFSRGNKKSRISLVTKQLDLLNRAIRLLRPGSSLVYSTCTLSPTQNQDMIGSVLKSLTKKSNHLDLALCDLSPIIDVLQSAQSELGIRVVPIDLLPNSPCSIQPKGLLVVPCMSANYGPTFIAKFKRMS